MSKIECEKNGKGMNLPPGVVEYNVPFGVDE